MFAKKQKIIKELLEENSSLKNQVLKYSNEIDEWKKRCEKAEDLKDLLNRLTDKTLFTFDNSILCSNGVNQMWESVPEHVPVYVDDLLGGKVIKQETNKCVVIEKDGSVKQGLTKEKTDKGFSYKLIRE